MRQARIGFPLAAVDRALDQTRAVTRMSFKFIMYFQVSSNLKNVMCDISVFPSRDSDASVRVALSPVCRTCLTAAPPGPRWGGPATAGSTAGRQGVAGACARAPRGRCGPQWACIFRAAAAARQRVGPMADTVPGRRCSGCCGARPCYGACPYYRGGGACPLQCKLAPPPCPRQPPVLAHTPRTSRPMEIETRSFQMQKKSFVLSQCYAVTAVSLFVIKL
jgi:hypothetical protein